MTFLSNKMIIQNKFQTELQQLIARVQEMCLFHKVSISVGASLDWVLYQDLASL